MFTGGVRRLGVPVLAVVLAAAGLALVVVRGPARADVTTPRPTGHGTSVAVLSGDFTGDGKTDLAVTGSQLFTSVPVADSAGDGSFTTPAGTLSDTDWAGWSSVPGVHVLTGDFNGDGKADLALVPPAGTPWWYTLPVAMSDGTGSFTVTNTAGLGYFTSTWAQTPGAQPVTGDFNGDGKTDIALVGGQGWNSVPVALSNGDGTFQVIARVLAVPDFAGWDAVAGVHVLTGDYNGDGRTDIALVPPPPYNGWWYTLPVAFSNGDGSFTVTNAAGLGYFTSAWATTPGASAYVGDFNGDGKDDIALTGGQGWNSIPVALSNGDGTFQVIARVMPTADFATWASWETGHYNTAQCIHAADFNGDGRTDIALACADTTATGIQTTFTIPVAFANGDGSFTVTNDTVGTVPPDWGSYGYKAVGDTEGWNVAGDFNGDGKTDIALVTSNQSGDGPAGVPMAFSNGDGSFTITVKQVPGLISNLDGIPSADNYYNLSTCEHLQMCRTADVDGDGKPDLIGFVPAGTAYPGMAGAVIVDASGSGWRVWGTGFCQQPQETCKLAYGVTPNTITADIVQFENSTPGRQGQVYVAEPDPASHRFGAPVLWGQNLCTTAGETCGLADVTGDFHPEVIDLTHASARPYPGSVLVASSNRGGGLSPLSAPVLWDTGVCAQAAGFCSVGYAYGPDSLVHTPADILQVTPDGTASVYFSNGTNGFYPPQQWGTGLCVHATMCTLIDVNKDGIGDVAYKDSSDHSLGTSQIWVAYGQRLSNTYAAPVIFDTNTLTTAAAVTGHPAGGVTLAAYTTPARPSLPASCQEAEDSELDTFNASAVFESLGDAVYDAAETLALANGASDEDATRLADLARAPFGVISGKLQVKALILDMWRDSHQCPALPPVWNPNAVWG